MSELKPCELTVDEAISALHMCRDLMLFDPSTGETHELWQENKDNQDLYNACGMAISALSRAQSADIGEYSGRLAAICSHYSIGQSDRYFLQSAVDALDALEEQDAQPDNAPLTCDGCIYFDDDYSDPVPCQGCSRVRCGKDYYRRKPESEGGDR